MNTTATPMTFDRISLGPHDVGAYFAARLPRLRQRGLNWRGACPFCDGRSDAFSVHSETGLWKCHRCQRGGDLIALEQELTNVGFIDAKRTVFFIIGRPIESGKYVPATPRISPAVIEAARHFSRALKVLVEESLEALPFDHPDRLAVTRSLDECRNVEGYLEWLANDARFTAAMVEAGRAHSEMQQMELASYVMELADGALLSAA